MLNKELFEEALARFDTQKHENRVKTIVCILKKKKLLEQQLELINKDLESAKKGEFLVLVEKYISASAAEEYE